MTNTGDKKYVTQTMLDEAIDAILHGMNKMVEGLKRDMNARFDLLEAKVDQSKSELKDDIDGLKADLSTSLSRREFEELKSRVDKDYPRLS